MQIALLQINPTVGALRSNSDLLIQEIKKAAKNGAEIITVPSAFSNTTGPIHWHTLLKARAIETGCFIVAPAQTGHHQCGRNSFGHSLIISPWGEILADAGKSVCFINTIIDLREVKKARLAIPSLRSHKSYLTNF